MSDTDKQPETPGTAQDDKIVNAAEFRAKVKEAAKEEVGTAVMLFNKLLRVVSLPINIPAKVAQGFKRQRDLTFVETDVYVSKSFAAQIEANPLTACRVVNRGYMSAGSIRSALAEQTGVEKLADKFSGIAKKRAKIMERALQEAPDHRQELAVGDLVPFPRLG